MQSDRFFPIKVWRVYEVGTSAADPTASYQPLCRPCCYFGFVLERIHDGHVPANYREYYENYAFINKHEFNIYILNKYCYYIE